MSDSNLSATRQAIMREAALQYERTHPLLQPYVDQIPQDYKLYALSPNNTWKLVSTNTAYIKKHNG
jgi:hypothetical protein